MDPNVQNPQATVPAQPENVQQQASQNINQQVGQAQAQAPKSSKKPIIAGILLIVLILLVVGGIAAYFIFDGSSENQEDFAEQVSVTQMQDQDIEDQNEVNNVSDWLTYTDSGNYFSVMYPPKYFVTPLENNVSDLLPDDENADIDVNCAYISDTDDIVLVAESSTTFICYGQLELNEIYPEIIESENYEIVTMNGYKTYKKVTDDGDPFNYKYYIADGSEGFVAFDNLNPENEDIFEKIVSSLQFN